jgi:hypothetical protein
MTTYNVGYLVGSLAKASINRKLAKALVRLAPGELKMVEISFRDCRSTAMTTTQISRHQRGRSKTRSLP